MLDPKTIANWSALSLWRTFVLAALVAAPSVRGENGSPSVAAPANTVLGIDGSRFTINRRPAFLLGISYYGALGAPASFLQADLGDAKRHGFNWLRVWVTWDQFGTNVSAVDATGLPREPFFRRLIALVSDCDERGLIVDLTLARSQENGRAISTLPDHGRAVESLVAHPILKQHRNWYLDLGNERDVRDARYVSPKDLQKLRRQARSLDPARLVTASFGGHDLSREDIRDALVTAELDFLAVHRPRHAGTAQKTEAETRHSLEIMRELGRLAPVLQQEPFRRGYTEWEPESDDFLADLRGAIAGGASGWCFHNGAQRTTADHQPRRSFDLREKRLFDQLDGQEKRVVDAIPPVAASAKRD